MLVLLICLLGLIISIYDIKFRSIPVIFLGIHLLCLMIYIFTYSHSTGIILGLLVTFLFLLCIYENYKIDWLYVFVICIGLILLKIAALLTVIMIFPIIICGFIIILFNSKTFPFMSCLTLLISIIILLI